MSERSAYALGRLPEDRRQPKLRLSRHLTERPTPPASADWISAVDQYPLFRNDSVGCCTAVGAGHTALAVDKYGQDRNLTLTNEDVLTMYQAVSGYDPANPSTDVGATLQDALNYWHKTGVAGNAIAAFAWIDAQDLDLIRASLATFGSLYIGMSISAEAMAQFDRGQPWTTTSRSRILGGHCVRIGAYDETSFTCTTWGRVQKMSVDFLLRWVDEITVVVDLDWMSANGTSPAGLDIATLNADYEALTGNPGPFPPALPTPEPTPAPLPTPGGPTPAWDSADQALLSAIDRWQLAKGF